ncbi:putative ankyrin repeat-containing protein [Trichoderma chlorosporum]
MRLLETDTLEIKEFGFGDIPKYAILSHRWGNYELTLQDMKGRIWQQTGFNDEIKIKAFQKVKDCCLKAKSESFDYVWIDSCCIDKTSSAELSEAINSMYLWYYKAERCYAYLGDVVSASTLQESEWFARGWTLQELLAPAEVYFLDKDWKYLGTKKSLQEAIFKRTRIPIQILSGADLETASIAQRMSWASDRKTTRVEDRAYSLMGIFGINMPLLYGEGERAFIRLQEEIMKISNDHSLFAWRSPDSRGGLLATSPDAFTGSSNIIHFSRFSDHSGPLAVSNRGIHVELRFIGRGSGGIGVAVLPCIERGKEGKPLAIYVRDTSLTMELFERVRSESYEEIDLRKFRKWQYPLRKMCIRMGRMALISRVEDAESQDDIMNQIYDDASLSKWMNSPSTSELFSAAREGNQDLVWLLLTRSDITIDLQDNERQTVLWHAIKGCHEQLARMLLSRSDVNADSPDMMGQTPLSWAAQHGHEAIIRMLLEKNVDVEAEFITRTPLGWAIENGHDAVIEPLLENGADIENTTMGMTPLLSAALNGREAVVRQLLKGGADVDATAGTQCTPLLLAAGNGHEAVIQLLLQGGANVEGTAGETFTPLLAAAENGHEAAARLLLENGANLGWKPLHLAAKKGHVAFVTLLLAYGAEIEAEDGEGRTPLFEAVKYAHCDIARLLLDKGANIEARDTQGNTPLFCAVEAFERAPDIIELLLERGADTMAKDNKGNTLMSLATDRGKKAFPRLLKKHRRAASRQ